MIAPLITLPERVGAFVVRWFQSFLYVKPARQSDFDRFEPATACWKLPYSAVATKYRRWQYFTAGPGNRCASEVWIEDVLPFFDFIVLPQLEVRCVTVAG